MQRCLTSTGTASRCPALAGTLCLLSMSVFWGLVRAPLLFFVMLDGGWSQIGKGWGDGGLPYLARYAGPQRVLALPDGGHLTEVGFPDGGTLCYELPLGQ